jgi:Na+/glutamate symporter
MAMDKHATAANATVGVFFGVLSGDVMQQWRIGDDVFFGVRSSDDIQQ